MLYRVNFQAQQCNALSIVELDTMYLGVRLCGPAPHHQTLEYNFPPFCLSDLSVIGTKPPDLEI